MRITKNKNMQIICSVTGFINEEYLKKLADYVFEMEDEEIVPLTQEYNPSRKLFSI